MIQGTCDKLTHLFFVIKVRLPPFRLDENVGRVPVMDSVDHPDLHEYHTHSHQNLENICKHEKRETWKIMGNMDKMKIFKIENTDKIENMANMGEKWTRLRIIENM